MAKIIPANLAPDAYPRIRGVVMTRPWRGLMIAQKWPRKRGRSKTNQQIFLTQQFAKASRMAANSEPMQVETAKFMSQGTVWLPRDLLVRAAYGNVYELVLPDGSIAGVTDKGYPEQAPVLEWLDSAAATLTANDPNWHGYTLRQVISPAEIINPGGIETRITFNASTSLGNATILAAYVGPGPIAGTSYAFAETPFQITFSGSGGATVTQGTPLVSDPIAWAPAAGEPLVISMAFGIPSALRIANVATGWTSFYKAGNDASTEAASGYTPYVAAVCVSRVETSHPV